MKKLISRTLTGIIFVVLTIASIMFSKYSFAAYFMLVLAYTLYEFYRLVQKGKYSPQFVPGIIIALFIFISFFLYDGNLVNKAIFWGLIPLGLLVPVFELSRAKKHSVENIAMTFLGIMYIAMPFSILSLIATAYPEHDSQYQPLILLGFFIMIWANDSGAYLFGSWLGKRKMSERISPLKTWEGAFGGAFLSVVVSVILFHYIDLLNTGHAIILSLLVVVAGTLGDLTESLIKRTYGIKDSGDLLPGHGGLLDRFDSMLFAAPVFYVYISIALNYSV